MLALQIPLPQELGCILVACKDRRCLCTEVKHDSSLCCDLKL